MDNNTDLSSKLAYYSTSSSVSKMPKHMVSSQAVNKEPPSSVRKIRKESATQAHQNKPCQTENCRGKLVSTGVNYEQPNASSSIKPQSNQHSCPFSNPPSPSCYLPPPSSCNPPPPRPCFMPPPCYSPPPCPRSKPDSQHSQQSENYMPYLQFYSPGPNRMGKPCWYRMSPPPCPYPLYPQYDMGAQQHNQHMAKNGPEQDKVQWQYPNQIQKYGLMATDSHDAAYDEDFDINDTGERYYNNQYQYNDDDDFDENICSECRLNDNDEEQVWQEPLGMQRRHCSPPPSFSGYPPPPQPLPVPAMPRSFPKPKCCPAKKRHCKKMLGGTDMRNIECDHCKAKAPNMECNHCKNKAQSQQSAKGAKTEYQHQFNKKPHK